MELAGNSFLSCVAHRCPHAHYFQSPILVSYVSSVFSKLDRELPGDRRYARFMSRCPQCPAVHLGLCDCSPETRRALCQVAETQVPIQQIYILLLKANACAPSSRSKETQNVCQAGREAVPSMCLLVSRTHGQNLHP